MQIQIECSSLVVLSSELVGCPVSTTVGERMKVGSLPALLRKDWKLARRPPPRCSFGRLLFAYDPS